MLCAVAASEVRCPVRVRQLVYCYRDSSSFARALREGDHELVLPEGESVRDGEWVLALFEISGENRATASAGRGLHRGVGAGPVLTFERRDWERLVGFAESPTALVEATAALPAADVEAGPPSIKVRGSQRARSPSSASFPAAAEAPTKRSFLGEASRRRNSDPFLHRPNARLLLVDDDGDIRDVVAAMLEAVGLTVESVTSAEEALVKVRDGRYDVLVLDWNLPGMTGLELCRAVRGDPLLANIPVLFLTAHASSRDVVDAFASGADDYVVKPFRAPELGARIFGLLRRARISQIS